MEISAKLVKELRDRTGAGMMECKKALMEAKGNLAEAEIYPAQSGYHQGRQQEPRAPRGRASSAATFIPARNWACWWK